MCEKISMVENYTLLLVTMTMSDHVTTNNERGGAVYARYCAVIGLPNQLNVVWRCPYPAVLQKNIPEIIFILSRCNLLQWKYNSFVYKNLKCVLYSVDLNLHYSCIFLYQKPISKKNIEII